MTFQCEFPGENHSDDLIEVYTGEADATVLCGFHASQPGAVLAARANRLAEFATPLDAIPDDLDG